MPCERFRDALTEVAAGEPVSPALDAHLAGCDGCRKELGQLRQLMAAADESLSLLATAEPSAALRVRIREAAEGAGPVPAAWPLRWAWPAAAVAVLVLAAAGAWRATVVHAPVAPALAESSRPAPPAAEPAAGSSLGADATPGVATTRSARGATRAAPKVRFTAPAEPEVLVPAGQQGSLLRFVALVHREGLHVPTLAATGQPLADLVGPAAIDIRPLEIVPLDPAESSGTD